VYGRVLIVDVNSSGFGDVPHIVEQFVDVFRIDVEGLIEPCGGIGHIRESAAKFEYRLADIRAILTDHGIDMVQGLICLLGSLSKILEKGCSFSLTAFTFWRVVLI